MLRLVTLGLLAVGLWTDPLWARTASRKVVRMEATAFTQNSTNPTSAGTVPHKGIVAADPAVLPMGSRIRITGAGAYNGVYTVTDTGNKINGRHIDLCLRSSAEAKRFGKRTVRVQVIEKGSGKEDAREKDIPATQAKR
jgi:3D (Asp-Asp-Asp) domain-containing protein